MSEKSSVPRQPGGRSAIKAGESVFASSEPDSLSDEFSSAFHTFVQTLFAIEDLTEKVAPQLAELDVPRWIPLLVESMRIRSKKQREAVEADLTAAYRRGEVRTSRARRSDAKEDEEEDGARASHEASFRMTGRLLRALVRDTLEERAGIRGGKRALLLRSLLATSVSALEVLVGNLAGVYYRAHPGALGGDEKEFSLSDLQAFRTLDDATEAAVARRVDDLLRESLRGWGTWFRRTSKIESPEIALDFDRLVEVIERRHTIVHHGGKVSRQYIANVRVPDAAGLKVGASLEVDDAYFRGALQDLLVFGVLLAARMWAHQVPSDRRRIDSEVDWTHYELMSRGQWDASLKVTDAVCAYIADDEMSRTRSAMNAWLARKRLYGLDAIRDEVTTLDVSASAPLVAFVRAALLEQVDEAIELLEMCIETKSITPSELREWPILEDVRGDPRFLRAVEKFERRRRSPRRQRSSTSTSPSTPKSAGGREDRGDRIDRDTRAKSNGDAPRAMPRRRRATETPRARPSRRSAGPSPRRLRSSESDA